MSDESSLLTNKHRKVLTGEEEAAHPDNMHSRLRKRVYAGLRNDGGLLLNKLPAEERRKIFRRWEMGVDVSDVEAPPSKFGNALWALFDPDDREQAEKAERASFRSGLVNLVAFLYLGIEESGVGDFEDILHSGLETAARESGRVLVQDEADFTISMEQPRTLSAEEIAERTRQGDDSLSVREVAFAHEKGALSDDEVREFFGGFEFIDMSKVFGLDPDDE